MAKIVTVRQQYQIQMASTLVEKWGLVAGMPDGENSDGSQRFRLMTPDEIVARACETAQAAYAEFIARGWYVESALMESDKPE